jgi:nicotinate dehydrogenase subunit B
VAGLAGWRPAIAPVTGVSASVYTAQTIEHGRQLAALGNCIGCHTQAEGVPYVGGRAIETPFGVIHSTNLTPDPETGIGRWSFSAFQRAMREGISRDGHHLYPAFPYTAFTRMSDEELTALYAFLMSQAPVVASTPASSLRFPFNLRPLMGLWNALHLQRGPHTVEVPVMAAVGVDPTLWQRGEYLVNGPGHCGACHTERDWMGAEHGGQQHLAGATVEGWQAPSLLAPGRRTLPWTEQALYGYLRNGHAPQAVAVGPMAEVISGLAGAPDEDLRAMAHYLASLQGRPEQAAVDALARQTIEQARASAPLPDATSQLFESACGACHSEGLAPVNLGLNLPLALNGKVRDASPDDLIRVLLDGIQKPAASEIAFMPGFRQALDDRQIADLLGWMRRRYAPEAPPWPAGETLRVTVARVRGAARSDR